MLSAVNPQTTVAMLFARWVIVLRDEVDFVYIPQIEM